MELENKAGLTTAQAPVTPSEPPKDDTLPSEQGTEPTVMPETQPDTPQTDFDIATFEKEYADNGNLSADSYKALEARGIPKALVDNYIAGQHAQSASHRAEFAAIAGGEDKLNELITWASGTLPQSEITTFNTIFQSRDKEAIKVALTGLTARHRSAVGNTTTKAVTDTSGGGTTSGYESMAQMVADVSDKRYKNDPAFRAKVAAKAAVSNW